MLAESLELIHSIAKTLLRIVVALGLWLIWSDFAVRLGGYFSPCDAFPQYPFELNCHTFFRFSWGFGFALIWLVVTPARPWLYILGIFLLVFIAVADVLRGGLHVLQSVAGWRLMFTEGQLTMVGGLSAVVIYVAIYILATKRSPNDRLNDR